jgi:hypothetical protein
MPGDTNGVLFVSYVQKVFGINMSSSVAGGAPPVARGKLTEAEWKKWHKAHPKARSEQVFAWMPQFKQYTPQFFLSKGFYLAGRMYMGAQGELNEIWLNDAGDGTEYRVYQSEWASQGSPAPAEEPKEPPNEDATELLKMTLESIRQDLEEDKKRTEEAEEKKAEIEKLNVTTDEFAKGYGEHVGMLDEGKKRVADQLDAIDDAITALKEMGADVSKVEQERNDVEYYQQWFDVERDMVDMLGRNPIRAVPKGP